MRIGLVLTDPPKASETFLFSLIHILNKQHDLVLFLSVKSEDLSHLKQCVYFNKQINLRRFVLYFLLFLRDFDKFKTLKCSVPTINLLHDLPIWTSRKLDYLHFTYGNLAFNRILYSEVMHCKYSLSFRGSDINVYPKRHKLFYDEVLSKCYKIHCNSIVLKSEVLNHNPSVETKISVINPGLNREFSSHAIDLLAMNRRRLLNCRIVFVSVGRLHWIKGYENIFKSLGKLKEAGIDFEYCLIGHGPEEEKLIFLSYFYNITENIKFLGRRTSVEIREFMASSNIFIQASWAEGFSNSTIEAQALGLPVIVTPVSGMDEIVLHRITGYITNSHGSDDILSGIRWYLELSNEEKLDLSIRASQRIRSKYSLEKLEKLWLHFFN